jgi:hypothetical protein
MQGVLVATVALTPGLRMQLPDMSKSLPPLPDFSKGMLKLPNFSNLFGSSSGTAKPVQTRGPRCDALLKATFGGDMFDPADVAAVCAPTVVWEDMSASKPFSGPEEVSAALASKFPAGSRLIIERLADGMRSSGFTWHREAAGKLGEGLRGTLYAEIDAEGRLSYVREGCEPMFKPGEAVEALLKAVTKSVKKDEAESTYTRRTPSTAAGVVEYLWREAYPGGAKPTEALRLFADDIVYEDFNYPAPFLGKAAVSDFVDAFDIPGIEFKLQRASEGNRGCAFTWKVLVNGQEGPEGISFYEVDGAGKVCYIRDIPAPSIKPPPLGSLAAIFDPELRVFKPRNA